jgi:hypothetical protein
MQSLDTCNQQEFWQSAMQGREETIIKPDNTDSSSNPEYSPEQTFVRVSSAINGVSKLEEQCRDRGVTLSTVILVAFARTLALLTLVTNPTFGLFQVGRSASFEDAERLSGPCLNITPLTVREAIHHSPLESAVSIRNQLSERVPYEQSSLHSIMFWTGSGSKPLFNTYINLLWHRERIELGPAQLFETLQVGVPTDFAVKSLIPGKTAVDGLKAEWLAGENVFFDLGPNLDTDAIDISARCDKRLLGDDGLKRVMQVLVNEVRRAVENVTQGTLETHVA